ncbi:hypothetical protein OS493_013972 [Desmophyllum pertusum]|uniref:TNase-like domain-containing protein n=1 Tax=Desmophyllum pertusum TaxID=174260 RepID=A0A9W9ZDC0_9CNID|nr:hypothetical protein OS493_013972 [Desmophyllum pertusum]
MEEEEKDDNNDILTKFANFVDSNLRIFRNVSWILAGAGIVLILRRTYAFRQFKAVSDVPTEFVAKNISFRGHVREVRLDNTLGIYHIPLLRGLKKSYSSSDTEVSEQSSLLAISLLGLEFREGGNKWLSDHVLSTKVQMTPLQVTKENTLDCIVYKKKGWFSSMSVNEEMVRQGVAVTCHVSSLTNSPLDATLQRRLLKAELLAEKKGVGIWIRPSLLERLQSTLSFPVSRLKGAFNAVQNLSLGRLFSRKATKDEEK